MLGPAGSSTAAKALITRSSDLDLGDIVYAGDVVEICPKSLCNSALQMGVIPNSTTRESLAEANFVGNVTACDLAFDHKATCIARSNR